jgi:hypothetical protein
MSLRKRKERLRPVENVITWTMPRTHPKRPMHSISSARTVTKREVRVLWNARVVTCCRNLITCPSEPEEADV